MKRAIIMFFVPFTKHIAITLAALLRLFFDCLYRLCSNLLLFYICILSPHFRHTGNRRLSGYETVVVV